ncbi:MAG: DNA repair protein [Faecousia sp.]
MTDKEFRRLRRPELLGMLLEKSKEVERLQHELDEARAQLASREIEIQNAGSIAEAALRLNGVFQAAEQAAAQYLENVRRITEMKSNEE